MTQATVGYLDANGNWVPVRSGSPLPTSGGGGEAPVSSVNGETGDVVLSAGDVGALPDSYSAVQSVQAGSNVTVDSSDPANPVVSAAGGGGLPEGGEPSNALVIDAEGDPVWGFPATVRGGSSQTAITTSVTAGGASIQISTLDQSDPENLLGTILTADTSALTATNLVGDPLDSSASPAGVVVHADLADIISRLEALEAQVNP